MENRKIAHFQLRDYSENSYTLICNLKNGSISYVMYGGHGSSGIPFSLSNLQCTLPVAPLEDETEEQFVDRIQYIIDKHSVKYVESRVPVNVTFA